MAGEDEYFAKYNADRIDRVLDQHIHEVQYVAPWGAAPVTLASAAGAYNWGGYSADIIANGAIAYLFDLHWGIFADADTNGHYEIEFYHGATDILVCQAKFTRTSPFTSSITIPLMSHQLPIGSRVRARLRHSAGVAACLVTVFYHQYEK